MTLLPGDADSPAQYGSALKASLASAGSLLAIAETGDGLLRPRVVLAG